MKLTTAVATQSGKDVLTITMDTTVNSETLVCTDQTARCQNPEDSYIHRMQCDPQMSIS